MSRALCCNCWKPSLTSTEGKNPDSFCQIEKAVVDNCEIGHFYKNNSIFSNIVEIGFFYISQEHFVELKFNV